MINRLINLCFKHDWELTDFNLGSNFLNNYQQFSHSYFKCKKCGEWDMGRAFLKENEKFKELYKKQGDF